jgi:uncharacterized protein YhfF
MITRACKDRAMWPRAEGLRAFAFGDEPGPLRQRLRALALAGIKVATAGLEQREYIDQGEAIETVGERQALLGDDGEVVAIVEITRVETHRLVDVPWEFAQAEGEGFRSIEHWREGHRSYFAEHGIGVTDDSSVVCVWFRVIEDRTPAR